MKLLDELKRRKVFRVAAIYAVMAWLLIQVAGTMAPMLTLPDYVPRLVLFPLVILFPMALFLANDPLSALSANGRKMH